MRTGENCALDNCPQNGGIPSPPLFELAASMPSAGTANLDCDW